MRKENKIKTEKINKKADAVSHKLPLFAQTGRP
jgi:hypothetical protein